MTRLNALRNCLGAVALAAAMGLSPGVSFGAAAADTAPVPAPAAHWVERKFNFTYMGFTAKYSCDGLEDNVRDVLLALGARKTDLKVHSLGCTRFNGPEPFPGVTAHFWVLEPAAQDQSGKVADTGAVATQWHTVDLTRLHGPTSEQGQCELLEQLERTALPLFTSRNLNFKSACVPHQVTLGDITFQVDVLRTTPATGVTPAA